MPAALVSSARPAFCASRLTGRPETNIKTDTGHGHQLMPVCPRSKLRSSARALGSTVDSGGGFPRPSPTTQPVYESNTVTTADAANPLDAAMKIQDPFLRFRVLSGMFEEDFKKAALAGAEFARLYTKAPLAVVVASGSPALSTAAETTVAVAAGAEDPSPTSPASLIGITTDSINSLSASPVSGEISAAQASAFSTQSLRVGSLTKDPDSCTSENTVMEEETGLSTAPVTESFPLSALSLPTSPSSFKTYPILLNIYQPNTEGYPLWVALIHKMLYHTGVEVNGIEHSFRVKRGVCKLKPHREPWMVYKRTIEIGRTRIPIEQVAEMMDEFARRVYPPGSYHKLDKNCNHYSAECCMLVAGAAPPRWINGAATVAAKIPWLAAKFPKPDPENFAATASTSTANQQSPSADSSLLPPSQASSPNKPANPSPTPQPPCPPALTVHNIKRSIASSTSSQLTVTHPHQPTPASMLQPHPILLLLNCDSPDPSPSSEQAQFSCQETPPCPSPQSVYSDRISQVQPLASANEIMPPSKMSASGPSIALPLHAVCNVTATADRPPEPSTSSAAPPKPTPAWRHRPALLKPFVPKHWMQKMGNFFRGGSAGMVKDGN